VREDMPDFRLKDPVANEAISLRDMLAHRSGLPRHDWVWMPGDRGCEEMFRVLGELEFSYPFRSVFQYQNLIYMAAGMLAGRVTGMTWEEFITAQLLRPLGMEQFGFGAEALARAANAATPYSVVDGRPRRARLYPVRTTPSGGINASIADMSRFLDFLLGGGAIDGRRLISEGSARTMQTPQIFRQTAEYDELGEIHYGLGLDVTHYRNETMVRHSGMWIGWGSYLAFLPDRGTGVVILINRTYTMLLEFLSYAIFDKLCGFPTTPWLERGEAKIAQLAAKRARERSAFKITEAQGPLGRPPADFVGTFEHPGYGRVAIAENDGRLSWSGLGVQAALHHRENDNFVFPDGSEDDPDDFIRLARTRVAFTTGPDGSIERLAVPLEPTVPDVQFHRIRKCGERAQLDLS
jgi:CubicO group peptidase (beta-lactamase class C family)